MADDPLAPSSVKGIDNIVYLLAGLPQWLSGKESACNAGATGDAGLIPGSGRSPGDRNGPTPGLLPGEVHGQRRLASYSTWGHKESDITA